MKLHNNPKIRLFCRCRKQSLKEAAADQTRSDVFDDFSEKNVNLHSFLH